MNDLNKKIVDVTTGTIKKHMVKLAIPSMAGMFAITVFNLTDTYFVSKLGVNQLAAMGFTFPVVMVIGAIAAGISVGASSLLARAIGSREHNKMSQIASNGILLSLISVILVALIGLLTLKPLFSFLGADQQTLPLVINYMWIWYIGVAVVVMPPVSDSYMRAIGDMVRPSIVMVVCAVFNIILDPILIFGGLGISAMGIKGAALATIISRFLGMVTSLSFLHFRYKLLDFSQIKLKTLLKCWTEILSIGLPSVMVRLLPQLLRMLLTKMSAVVGGVVAVAAIAAGSRLESFSIIVSMGIGVSLIPLIGQNWGAKKFDRVNTVRVLTNKVAYYYGIILFVIAILFSKQLANIFSDDTEVIKLIQIYIIIIALGSIGLNLYNWTSEMLNAAGKPMWTLNINILGTLLVMLPLTYYGAIFLNFKGMVSGLVLGQFIVGIYAIWIGNKQLNEKI